MLRQSRMYMLALSLCFIFTCSILTAQTSSKFSFRFAFLKIDKTVYTPQEISRPVKFINREKFKLFMGTDREANIYVITENPDGKVSVILRSKLSPNNYLFIPSKDKSFSIKPPEGTDKFFILASAVPQKNLEKLLDELQNNQGDLIGKSRAVSDEISRIKQEISGLGADPVKPAPIGGTARKTIPGIDKFTANEYSGRDLYVKTIRVSH